MMELKTVALIAAAFVNGRTINANLPIVGFNAFTTHSAAVTRTYAHDSAAVVRGQVSGVTVVAGTAGPEVVIAVDAGISFNHFTLENPHRVVVDLAGAEVGMRVRNYDGT